MEIKEALAQSVREVFKLYKLKAELREEAEKDIFSSTEPINVLISFSTNLRGNIVFGLGKAAALKIASVINGTESAVLDAKTKGGLGELARFIVDLAISKSQLANGPSLSPPIIITGENIFLMIGQVKTVQLVFDLDESTISLSYYLEQGGKSSSSRYVLRVPPARRREVARAE